MPQITNLLRASARPASISPRHFTQKSSWSTASRPHSIVRQTRGMAAVARPVRSAQGWSRRDSLTRAECAAVVLSTVRSAKPWRVRPGDVPAGDGVPATPPQSLRGETSTELYAFPLIDAHRAYDEFASCCQAGQRLAPRVQHEADPARPRAVSAFVSIHAAAQSRWPYRDRSVIGHAPGASSDFY